MRAHPIRLVHVFTVPQSIMFVRGHGKFFRDRGFALTFVSSPGDKLGEHAEREGADAIAVEMPRKITPLADLKSLVRLTRVLRAQKPHIVHAHTPKGGLLGTTAAFLARVPVRVYHMRGLPLQTQTGLTRFLLSASERVSCALATRVICISPSVKSEAVREGLCSPGKIRVLANGGNGVDAEKRFAPDALSTSVRDEVRASLGIAKDARVIGFVGRLVNDKGVRELFSAWRSIREKMPDAALLIVGKYEERDAIAEELRRALAADPRVHRVEEVHETAQAHDAHGGVAELARFYAAMDVLALPTYREGFPNVVAEASSMRVPVVATRVTGCIDAVEDGITGLLVPPRDARALEDALCTYLEDPALRALHGSRGRARVLADFAPRAVQEALHEEYRSLMIGAERAGFPQTGWRRLVKTTFDRAAAAAGLVATAPVMAAVAGGIALTMGRPVLFRQDRPGLHGKTIRIAKFRTMKDAFDRDGKPLPDEARLTGFGKALRATSLDELPQLWNVLRGDLSLVGPRPLLMHYLSLYSPEQARRHDVLPGITGWSQVHGRNAISWKEKLAYDTWYVDHWSLLLDVEILLKTVKTVIFREGIQREGHATTPYFTGNEDERAALN